MDARSWRWDVLLGLLLAGWLAGVAWWPRAERAEPEQAPEVRGDVPGTGASTVDVLLRIETDEDPPPLWRFRLRPEAARSAGPVDFEPEPVRAGGVHFARWTLPWRDPAGSLRGELLNPGYCLREGGREFQYAGEFRLELELVPSRTLHLKAVWTDGTPVAGARVRTLAGALVGVTTEDGLLTRDEPRSLEREWIAGTDESLRAGIRWPAGDLEPVRVVLTRRQSVPDVLLRVRLSTGEPVQGAMVRGRLRVPGDPSEDTPAEAALRLAYDPADGRPVLEATTDAAGEVRLPLARPATLEVEISHPEHGRMPVQSFDLSAPQGGQIVREASYAATTRATVHVRSGDEPVPYCPLELFAVRPGVHERIRALRADEDGHATLSAPAEGTFFLVARPVRLAPLVRRIESGRDQTIELKLESGAAVKVAVSGMAALEDDLRSIELCDRESGLLLYAERPGPDESVRFLHVPSGRELLLRRPLPGESSTAIGETFVLPEDIPEIDLGNWRIAGDRTP